MVESELLCRLSSSLSFGGRLYYNRDGSLADCPKSCALGKLLVVVVVEVHHCSAIHSHVIS